MNSRYLAIPACCPLFRCLPACEQMSEDDFQGAEKLFLGGRLAMRFRSIGVSPHQETIRCVPAATCVWPKLRAGSGSFSPEPAEVVTYLKRSK